MQPESTTTRLCASHGDYQARMIIAPIPDMPPLLSGCPHCRDDADRTEQQKKARAAQQMRSSKLKEIFDQSGIPPRFAGRSLDDYNATQPGQNMALQVCRAFSKTWPDQYRKGGSLVLTGGPGTGKTHLACAIANQIMPEHMATVTFGTVSKILRSVRSTYSGKSERTEDQALEALLIPDLLIVDEVGAQTGSDHEITMMFEIFNNRYQALRPTIVISNLSSGDLEQFLGHRVMDRFQECGTVLAFDWPSYRSTTR